MVSTLTEQAYLINLKESIRVPNTHNLLDFSESSYTGNETFGELLIEMGIDIDTEILEEGILSMPINSMKSLVAKLMGQTGSVDGMKQSKKTLEPMAKKIKPSMIEKQISSMATSKGISDSEIQKSKMELTRAIAGGSNVVNLFISPIGWILLLIALIKSGNIATFKKEFSAMIDEIKKSMSTGSDSPFDDSTELGAQSVKFLLYCLIPPWIQAVILYPLALVYAIAAYFAFVLIFLDQFGKEE